MDPEDPSWDAFAKILADGTAARWATKIIWHLYQCGDSTSDEIEVAQRGLHTTISGRITFLWKVKLVEDSGIRRSTAAGRARAAKGWSKTHATVWRLTKECRTWIDECGAVPPSALG